MKEGRWTSITPSQFQHERKALEYVRTLLPDSEPFRAWSNFTFTASTGHVREVDLFVAAPSGLYLIEIKSLRGVLTASGANWVQTNGSHVRYFDNPLHLADSKAKQLRTLLNKVSGKTKIPYIHAAVFLSVPSLQVQLPDHHMNGIYGPENGNLPDRLWSDLLKLPPDDENRRIKPELSKQLGKWLHDIGIARSRSHLPARRGRLLRPPPPPAPSRPGRAQRPGDAGPCAEERGGAGLAPPTAQDQRLADRDARRGQQELQPQGQQHRPRRTPPGRVRPGLRSLLHSDP